MCLICIDISVDLGYEDLTYIRFLKVDLNERHIKTLLILTKGERKGIYES